MLVAGPSRAPGAAVARRACAIACALAFSVAPVSSGVASIDPNAQKADMVCNMAKFVQWPESIVQQNHGQLVVAVLGEDELAASIASVLSSRSVNGKPVFVRFARRVQDVRGCQIVYIAGSEIGHLTDVVEALNGSATLTLADVDGFATRGGMVNFSGIAPNLRFEICLARTERAGLRVSSRLLALAHVVDPAP
jgi:hypothetical protein